MNNCYYAHVFGVAVEDNDVGLMRPVDIRSYQSPLGLLTVICLNSQSLLEPF